VEIVIYLDENEEIEISVEENAEIEISMEENAEIEISMDENESKREIAKRSKTFNSSEKGKP
jgi:hypothetical protein